ncbi:hypothetical protein N2152v2_001767 [Parachlorella kessleri]
MTEESHDAAAYAATLTDLAQLRLSEGKTQEAQELFKQALDAQQGLSSATLHDAEEEDWEAAASDDWEARLPTHPTNTVASGAARSTKGTAEGRNGSSDSRAVGAASKAGSSGKGAAPRRIQAAAAARATSPAPAGAAADELAFAGAHILEIFDLSNAVRTAQLEQFLARLQPQAELPPLLRWVDDYRALALFANPREAQAALQAADSLQPTPSQPVYSLRAFADASALSRAVPAPELQPPKPRPLTTATVARRLIGGALNMRLRDREEEKVIQAARRDLKQAEVQRREKLDEAWGDE